MNDIAPTIVSGRAWTVENGVITITVVSKKWDDVEELIRHLGSQGFQVGDDAKDLMRKPAFTTSEGLTLKLGVIKGEEFEGDEIMTKDICIKADNRGWSKPPAEAAPLIRQLISDDDILEMGLTWLHVMHEPIVGSDGRQSLLGVGRRFGGSHHLGTYLGGPEVGRVIQHGFLFLLSLPQ